MLPSPSEYIKKYSKFKDFRSLQNILDSWRRDDAMWKLITEVLTKPKDYPEFNEEEWNWFFEFLAEIQFAEATIIKWRKTFNPTKALQEWEKKYGTFKI